MAGTTTALTTDTIEQFIAQPGISIIDVWAEWCGPCRQFAPVFEAAAQANPDIHFAKVNSEEQPQISEAFGVQAIPTLLVFRDQVLLYAEAGALPPAALTQLLGEVRKLDMDEVRRKLNEREASGEEA